ncbi:thrombospondin type-1 domain-containing protein 4 isoform X1 [Canis lupus dingo]|uniref:thrombospondin type-1 domain-containing protein 4 isoform X1 n=1 Tax=Canis lupus dingo TaxID=286419 RepID=UPI000DC6C399|nr:thrombospondin type-1 domain-containing protein 4 isoform X1 [Canis lupus dingo]XP_048960398.1 thrombospondin type-1 domain-containing protein 4 isoform X1 [Canis lupus dingo]
MVSHFMGSLSVLGSLLLLGLQLVCPQPSTEHRKVPQRTAAQGGPEDGGGGGGGGVWGAWGPWSACSRSCSGGVMEQTRPCLPGSARARGALRPGAPPRAFAGHVVSAVRTSVPLLRGRDPDPDPDPDPGEPRARPRPRPDRLRHGPAQRGSRHPQAPRDPAADRRSRTRGPIGPGKYGYGKAPYILPLQTDSAHSSQRLRRQRASARPPGAPEASGPGHGYGARAHQAPRQGPRYQSDSGPRSGLQASEASLYQLPLTHDRGFPAASGLFHGLETSSSPGMGAARSFSQPARSAAISCIGAYRQYKLCNTNVCPESSRSIREVQCASYNNKPFMGRFYEWEPFAEVKGNRKCELNCQAMGYRFYVRQAEKVIDGTPCDQNGTAICVSGQCKSIGCDDYLGSDKVVDKCGVCGGDNTGCQVVSGVFKHALTSLGYHRVVEIPQGATKINITEMYKSNNYLALRSRSGRSIINGNWAIDRPGKYEGGGTMFTYKRPNEISSTAGESFLAEGPTNEILDVYMIHQQPNPGVHYEYVIMGTNIISPQVPPHRRPGEPFNGQLVTDGRSQEEREDKEETEEKEDVRGGAPEVFTSESAQTFPVRHPDGFSSHRPDNLVPAVPQPPRRGRDHNWKQLGTTECSTSCGKGSQFPIFRCVHRNTHKEVPESYCDSSMKPTPEEEPCNIFPCPAFWDIGEWSECSKTCGLGMQHRQVLCRQVYANRSLTVQPYRCQHLEKPETTSTCQLKICSEWQIRTDWTSCSVPCGVGQRTRDVKCVSNIGDVVDDEECNMKLRPNDIENCDMGPCAKSWFLTEWSERCSAECGAGVRTRSVVCMTNHISSLPLEGCGNNRPTEATPCDNGPCTGKVEWFAGSWSQCSVECGSGTQQREVICVRKNTDTFEVLDPYECSFLEKPPSQQSCHLKPCGAKWFNTEWSMCSKSCQGGFRVREVRCLSDDMTLSNLCDPQLKPEEKESCNPQDCVPEVDENCKDRYYNCNVVVQARLCVYNYYKTACCASCTRVAARHAGFLGSR